MHVSTKALQINDVSQVKVALEFLQDCSLLLFYPDLDLVFTDPQALLDAFPAIVKKFYGKNVSGSKAELDNYKRGILSSFHFKGLCSSSAGPDAENVLCCGS